MFKQVPGNDAFLISKDGKIVERYGYERYAREACTLPVADNKVTMVLFKKTQRVDLTWLGLMAHFEVDLPVELEHRFWSFRFREVYRRKNQVGPNIQPYLKRPIELEGGFRIIPSLSSYAVNSSGQIMRVKDRELLSVSPNGGYLAIFVHVPELSKKSPRLVHRLVAEVWVHNPDPFEFGVVNHLDGVTYHNNARNLEWTTYGGNNKHAVDTGLRPDNTRCKVRDFETQKVTEFASIRDAVEFMGLPPDTNQGVLTRKTRGRLLGGKYEFRENSDARPWFYEGKTVPEASGRFAIWVTSEDGQTKEYPDVRTFKKEFAVWNVSGIERIVQKARVLHPKLKFEYKDHYVAQTIEAYEVATGKTHEAPGMRQMARLLGTDFAAIQKSITQNSLTVRSGFVYRVKSDLPWDPSQFTVSAFKPRCILAKNTKSGEQRTYQSLREIEREFHVTRDLVKTRLRNKTPHEGWVFEEVDS